jgi:hypothetical protein
VALPAGAGGLSAAADSREEVLTEAISVDIMEAVVAVVAEVVPLCEEGL